MADFGSSPLLVADTLGGLGQLAFKYQDTARQDELARYLHDKLSAEAAARARVANNEISSRERVSMAPWDRGITQSETARNALFGREIDQRGKSDAERNAILQQEIRVREALGRAGIDASVINAAIAAMGGGGVSSQDAINIQSMNDQNKAAADAANLKRNTYITDFQKATPGWLYKEVTGKDAPNTFMGLGGSTALNKADAAKAADIMLGKEYAGSRSVFRDPNDPSGLFLPIPVAKPKTSFDQLLPFIKGRFPDFPGVGGAVAPDTGGASLFPSDATEGGGAGRAGGALVPPPAGPGAGLNPVFRFGPGGVAEKLKPADRPAGVNAGPYTHGADIPGVKGGPYNYGFNIPGVNVGPYAPSNPPNALIDPGAGRNNDRLPPGLDDLSPAPMLPRSGTQPPGLDYPSPAPMRPRTGNPFRPPGGALPGIPEQPGPAGLDPDTAAKLQQFLGRNQWQELMRGFNWRTLLPSRPPASTNQLVTPY